MYNKKEILAMLCIYVLFMGIGYSFFGLWGVLLWGILATGVVLGLFYKHTGPIK